MDLNYVKWKGWLVLPFLLRGLLLLCGLFLLYGVPERSDAVVGGKKGQQGGSEHGVTIWDGRVITLAGFISGGMNFVITGEGDVRTTNDTSGKDDDEISNSISHRVRSTIGEGYPRRLYFSCGNTHGCDEFHIVHETMYTGDDPSGEVRQTMQNCVQVPNEHLQEDARAGGFLLPLGEDSHLGGIPQGTTHSSTMCEEQSIKWKWEMERGASASLPFGPSNNRFNMPPNKYNTARRILASTKEDGAEASGMGVNKGGDTFQGSVLNVHFTENKNLYTNVNVGGQPLKLALNSRVEGIYVFMKDSQACHVGEVEENTRVCYDPKACKKCTWCNNDLLCLPAILSKPYECYSEKNLLLENKGEYPSMYYDSLKFTESHVEGSDDVEVVDLVVAGGAASDAGKEAAQDGQRKGVNAKDNIFHNNDLKLVTDLSLYKGWSLFKDTDGIMGLAGKELSCRNVSAWNSIVEKNKSLYALDINLPEGSVKPLVGSPSQKDFKKDSGSSYAKFVAQTASKKGAAMAAEPNGSISEIHIGDYKKNFGPIVWSEPRERGGIFSDSFMQFTLYNLEVCEKNIFGKYSSNWQGVIDLSSKCLVLPKMFWLSLMEYLPVNKNDERCIPKSKEVTFDEGTIPRMCSVDATMRPLPVLKFYLADNDTVSDNNIGGVNGSSEVPLGGSPQGKSIQEVHIPLDNLIINEEGPNDGYLCILPDVHEGVSSENSGRTTKPLIKFGTYVINNFYVVVDQENYRIGFANKKDYHFTNARCTQRAECVGDQFYEPALNICVDPDCSVWYFYTLNEETKKCESVSSRFYVFLVILLLLLLLDIQSYYFYRKSVHVAKVSSR
ncbi:hypothetical protein AK88_04160 [Plasmodium fragile]|uniref:Peptidase A1 domain-containing protein n=1 Tax=Plasmodium fragile TaxID=5857 RepID=A0A0D9QGR1_PLAFR|nr:uncharacterized protein AK88_04160 [Plasmodium fragile]KJP86189.1 hypothetical protein AK88_04160 [Plasmodium fragile]